MVMMYDFNYAASDIDSSFCELANMYGAENINSGGLI
jgi:hypothetical protein